MQTKSYWITEVVVDIENVFDFTQSIIERFGADAYREPIQTRTASLFYSRYIYAITIC